MLALRNLADDKVLKTVSAPGATDAPAQELAETQVPCRHAPGEG